MTASSFGTKSPAGYIHIHICIRIHVYNIMNASLTIYYALMIISHRIIWLLTSITTDQSRPEQTRAGQRVLLLLLHHKPRDCCVHVCACACAWYQRRNARAQRRPRCASCPSGARRRSGSACRDAHPIPRRQCTGRACSTDFSQRYPAYVQYVQEPHGTHSESARENTR
jgi:hypothetical protein